MAEVAPMPERQRQQRDRHEARAAAKRTRWRTQVLTARFQPSPHVHPLVIRRVPLLDVDGGHNVGVCRCQKEETGEGEKGRIVDFLSSHGDAENAEEQDSPTAYQDADGGPVSRARRARGVGVTRHAQARRIIRGLCVPGHSHPSRRPEAGADTGPRPSSSWPSCLRALRVDLVRGVLASAIRLARSSNASVTWLPFSPSPVVL